jgi:hypothetical protein
VTWLGDDPVEMGLKKEKQQGISLMHCMRVNHRESRVQMYVGYCVVLRASHGVWWLEEGRLSS